MWTQNQVRVQNFAAKNVNNCPHHSGTQVGFFPILGDVQTDGKICPDPGFGHSPQRHTEWSRVGRPETADAKGQRCHEVSTYVMMSDTYQIHLRDISETSVIHISLLVDDLIQPLLLCPAARHLPPRQCCAPRPGTISGRTVQGGLKWGGFFEARESWGPMGIASSENHRKPTSIPWYWDWGRLG